MRGVGWMGLTLHCVINAMMGFLKRNNTKRDKFCFVCFIYSEVARVKGKRVFEHAQNAQRSSCACEKYHPSVCCPYILQ